jgi:hypothetical protein
MTVKTWMYEGLRCHTEKISVALAWRCYVTIFELHPFYGHNHRFQIPEMVSLARAAMIRFRSFNYNLNGNFALGTIFLTRLSDISAGYIKDPTIDDALYTIAPIQYAKSSKDGGWMFVFDCDGYGIDHDRWEFGFGQDEDEIHRSEPRQGQALRGDWRATLATEYLARQLLAFAPIEAQLFPPFVLGRCDII